MTGRRTDGGFTLLEMIVAMGLLAVISVLLVQGLRFGSTAQGRLVARSATAETATLGRDLVRRQLQRAQRLVWGKVDEPRLAFDGARDRVRFVTAEPPYRPGAALVLWEIALEGAGTRRRVILRRAAYDPEAPGFDPLEAAAPRELMEVDAQLAFAYFGRPDERGSPRWQDDWRSPRRLPLAVRLRGGEDGGGWPELVVRPVIDAAAGCAVEGAPENRGCEP